MVYLITRVLTNNEDIVYFLGGGIVTPCNPTTTTNPDNPNQEYKFLIYVRDDVTNDKNGAGEMCS